MGADDDQYIRQLRLQVQDNRLTLRPRRSDLGLVCGLLTWLLLVIYGLLPFTPRTPHEHLSKEPYVPIVVAFGVYLLISRLLRGRIVFDRQQNQLWVGRRLRSTLNQIIAVEVDDNFHAFAMNETALLLADGRKVSLLLYDSRANAAVWKFARTIAEFLGVPVKTAVSKREMNAKRRHQ